MYAFVCFLALMAIGTGCRGTGAESMSANRRWVDASRNLQDRLKGNKVLAVHARTTEYPSESDFAGLDLAFTPIRVSRGLRAPIITLRGVPSEIERLAKGSAGEYGVDAYLVLAVIKVESDFNPGAVSKVGARGLMQLMPDTAIDMGVTDIFDPAQNVAAGTQYLSRMMRLFGGDVRLGLAAYHAGPGSVKKYGGVPPYKGIDDYIQRVQSHMAKFTEEGIKEIEVAQLRRPEPAALPEAAGKYYIIHFENGLTQRAEVIVSAENHYLVTCEGRVDRINKAHVDRIVEST